MAMWMERWEWVQVKVQYDDGTGSAGGRLIRRWKRL
jgi:hypothetical protein